MQRYRERNRYMLTETLADNGYDWWWHSFTGRNAKTGKEKGFFIEYFIVNPALGEFDPIFGENGKNRPSYMMIKAGCWGDNAKQLHRFFGTKFLDIYEDELRIIAEDCIIAEDVIRGSVDIDEDTSASHPEYMSDSGSMSWQLRVDKRLPFNVGYGTSRLFRKMNAFEMYWHVQGRKTFYTGSVFLDGEEYIVRPENCYGYADKNWGTNFTSPWLWLASSNLRSKLTGKKLYNSAFDIGGGCPKVFGIPIRKKLLGAFNYEGSEIEFNFSKFWTLARNKFVCYETKDKVIWKVKSTNAKGFIMDIRVTCRKKDMLLVNYESPDGFKRHNKLWNGGNGIGLIKLYKVTKGKKRLIDYIEARNIGCEYGEY